MTDYELRPDYFLRGGLWPDDFLRFTDEVREYLTETNFNDIFVHKIDRLKHLIDDRSNYIRLYKRFKDAYAFTRIQDDLCTTELEQWLSDHGLVADIDYIVDHYKTDFTECDDGDPGWDREYHEFCAIRFVDKTQAAQFIFCWSNEFEQFAADWWKY